MASNAIKKVPVDSISISPKANVEILVNSAPASGMSDGLEDHSLVSDLNLSPQEGACAASGNISTSAVGPVSLPPHADVDPPSDPSAVGSAADSLGMQNEPMTLFKSCEAQLAAFQPRLRQLGHDRRSNPAEIPRQQPVNIPNGNYAHLRVQATAPKTTANKSSPRQQSIPAPPPHHL
ncbi:hypothetical protein Nepgr_024029 [Nepenthes gracilis]|uniref:Uncharacterized protein n=1 Tax=Nepenthes gracilis TaxID=150966 RepID=A0AAD3Y029_NEPGR|nr:hypothetical protein Nepgr_024029 [Nepenthes gracilis]